MIKPNDQRRASADTTALSRALRESSLSEERSSPSQSSPIKPGNIPVGGLADYCNSTKPPGRKYPQQTMTEFEDLYIDDTQEDSEGFADGGRNIKSKGETGGTKQAAKLTAQAESKKAKGKSKKTGEGEDDEEEEKKDNSKENSGPLLQRLDTLRNMIKFWSKLIYQIVIVALLVPFLPYCDYQLGVYLSSMLSHLCKHIPRSMSEIARDKSGRFMSGISVTVQNTTTSASPMIEQAMGVCGDYG
ncbi:unnamed protein product [Aureobasidium pullulans]|nr:unnamed protein product [Aureobasidium pullulans]